MKATLPSKMTEEGAVARLLLAEARDPSSPSYSATDSLLSMQWMQLVLKNRLDHNPAQFLAPHAKTMADIIKAPGQFAGFANYPHYDSGLVDRLQSIIDIANAAKDVRSVIYRAFVQNVLDVAKSPPVADPAVADDPKSLGLHAWKSSGASSPGGRFVKYKDLAGNSFYELKK